MAKPVPLDSLLTRIASDGWGPVLLWQIGVLALCAFAAWGAKLLFERYFARASAWPAPEVGRRVGTALLMLLALLLGRETAALWLPHTHLLDLAMPLVLALVAVRLVVYALRYIVPPPGLREFWERAASWLIWGAFALHITGILPRIHAAMEALSFRSGTHRFSLWLLLEAAGVIGVALVVALSLARVIESRLMGVAQMNLSLRIALAKAARTLLLVLAVLVALPAVGIDLTVLSVFGGALGVGIGFGLQKVASNYVSGFIILLDRSVRIGDLVTVDNKHGEVREINTRHTLLRSLDGTESIVPNEMLITHTVVTHPLSKPAALQVTLPIPVPYGTDLETAEALMLEAAREQSRVLVDEAQYDPRVFLKEFADNGIVLELAVWVRDPNEGPDNLRSALNWAIWRRFRAGGVILAIAAPDAGRR
ncbi:MAG: mechanosensitive ion channel family protein [Thiobacillus sp.]